MMNFCVVQSSSVVAELSHAFTFTKELYSQQCFIYHFHYYHPGTDLKTTDLFASSVTWLSTYAWTSELFPCQSHSKGRIFLLMCTTSKSSYAFKYIYYSFTLTLVCSTVLAACIPVHPFIFCHYPPFMSTPNMLSFVTQVDLNVVTRSASHDELPWLQINNYSWL